MVDYQTLSIVLTGIGLMIALTYYALQIRNQNKTRQAQIIMQVYQKMSDADFMESFWEVFSREWDTVEEYLEKYPSRTSFAVLTNYLEGVGILLKKGLVGRALVYEFFPTNANVLWHKFKPITMWTRENISPSYLRTVEYLAEEMDKERILQGDPPLLDYYSLYRKSLERTSNP